MSRLARVVGSLLEFMVSDALPAVVENWPEVAHHAAQRLGTEGMAQGGVPDSDRIADRLPRSFTAPRQPLGPVVPTILRLGSIRLSLFSTIAQFGAPEDVTLGDLKVELFFPSDRETEQALVSFAAAKPA